MLKYKTALYPFNEHVYPLLFNSDLIEKIDMTQVIAFSGSGIENDKVKDYRGIEYTVKTDIDYSNCDAILLNLFEINENFYGQIINLLKSLSNKDIKIITDMNTYEKDIKIINSNCDSNWVDFKELNDYSDELFLSSNIYSGISYDEFKSKQFKPINASIVGICSTNENCMKFDTMLSLIRIFRNKGYDVAGIGSKEYSKIFGLSSFQQILFNNKLADIERLCVFMETLNYIDSLESPDIIFVCIPGGIIPVNSTHHGDYGVLATQLLSALKCDQLVLNLGYSNDYNIDFLEELSNICKYKLNNTVTHFGLSNKMFFPPSLTEKELSYINVTNIDKNMDILNQNKYPVFNISSMEGVENLAISLEKNLLFMGHMVFM